MYQTASQLGRTLGTGMNGIPVQVNVGGAGPGREDLVVIMYFMSRSLNIFARFLFDGEMLLSRLCHPRTGMMELSHSVAGGKAVAHCVTRSPHAVTVMGPLWQLFMLR